MSALPRDPEPRLQCARCHQPRPTSMFRVREYITHTRAGTGIKRYRSCVCADCVRAKDQARRPPKSLRLDQPPHVPVPRIPLVWLAPGRWAAYDCAGRFLCEGRDALEIISFLYEQARSE